MALATTLIPFATLPQCLQGCQPLWDANGRCVPPGAAEAEPSVYTQCFCGDSAVTAFSTTTGVVCPTACPNEPAALGSATDWFKSFCANQNGANPPSSTSTRATNPIAPDTGGGDWISNHWGWVVFLVVMVVAIAGIWTGACVWRRRYLRKKDRQYALGKRLSTVGVVGAAAAGANGSGNNVADASNRSVHLPAAGMFQPAPITSAGVYGPESEREKKERNKWNPAERT